MGTTTVTAAIVGMACVFPEAPDPGALWESVLCRRRAFLPDPAREGSLMARIEGASFDRRGDGLATDTAAQALADAGFPDAKGLDRERVAVVIGAAGGALLPQSGISINGLPDGTDQRTIAGNVCHRLDLRGSGYDVAAGCASSLVAVVNACRSLRDGGADFVLAGGVDLGHDRPDGYWPGEGCGIVALMRTADALDQGLRVYAEIAGWGVSSDGRDGDPRGDSDGQLLALRRAYAHAGVLPGEVGLFEGYGGAAADATDLAALAALLTPVPASAGPFTRPAIGSVKSNIGHTRAAAGVAGLIKAAQSVAYGVLPPATACGRRHDLLDDLATPLRALAHPEPWPTEPDDPRHAGVSAMGPGGVNTHLVLRSAPFSLATPSAAGSASVAPSSTNVSLTSPSFTSADFDGHPFASPAAATSPSAGRPGAGPPFVRPGSAPPPAAGRSTGPPFARPGSASPLVAGRTGATPSSAGTRPPRRTGPHEAAVTGCGGPVPGAAPSMAEPLVFAVSGGGEREVLEVLDRVADQAGRWTEGELHDLACALSRRPAGGPTRVAIVAGTSEQLAERARLAGRRVRTLVEGRLTTGPGFYAGVAVRGRVTLLFPGQGAPVRRKEEAGRGPASIAGSGPASIAGSGPRVVDTAVAQPAILDASIAALRELDRLGLNAGAAIGHSIGEIAGMVWAGCLTVHEARRLVRRRGQLMSELGTPETGMVSVRTTREGAERLVAGTGMVIAAVNGPASHVLAGRDPEVAMVAKRAAEEGVEATVLPVSRAFHSPHVAVCGNAFADCLSGLVFQAPQRTLISTVTGMPLAPGDDLSMLLRAQLVVPVRFWDAVCEAADATDLFCEAGPGRGLTSLVAETGVPTVSTDTFGPDDVPAAEIPAALWACAALPDLATLYGTRHARPMDIWRDRHYL
ncbi:type I polyketide synthase [Streptosporangium sp. KLBMP 9127]|nr:acyltransferase domain-containing protein [Streptosporangium sp. KLBMP 9127]